MSRLQRSPITSTVRATGQVSSDGCGVCVAAVFDVGMAIDLVRVLQIEFHFKTGLVMIQLVLI
jgi:hypothetical protein